MDHNTKIVGLIDTFKKVLEVCPEIVYIGDPILKATTSETNLHDGMIVAKKLIEVLGRYRELTGVGRGLAAPQIGEDQSVFVTFVDNHYKTYMNPKILKRSLSTNLFIENCLSCGNIAADIERPESITIEYMDEKADTHIETVDGFLARLLQHEYDHLEGIMNVDLAEKGTIHFMTEDPLKQILRKK